MPKIGIVGTSGGWSSEVLAASVENLTGYRLLIDLQKLSLDLAEGKGWYQGIDLTELDALIIKKAGARYSSDLQDRLEMLRFLNERGLKMFSRPLNIMRVLDRLSCTATLRAAGIPMPETTVTEDVDAAFDAVKKYGECVFKPLYTSKARGMLLIRLGPRSRQEVENFKKLNNIIYIQKRIDHKGKDLGITFLGGKYLATYARCGDKFSWNTTTQNGGKYEPYTPSQEIIDLAHKAQNLFGLDFTCVDVAETSEGPMVFEVSAFGGFRGIHTACGIDAARCYTEYVLGKIG